jgi:hypothetical protein
VFELDRALCKRCGAWVQTVELVSGRHECDTAMLVAFQTRIARVEIDLELGTTIAAWENDPRLANRLAFARYLRDRADGMFRIGASPFGEQRRAA